MNVGLEVGLLILPHSVNSKGNRVLPFVALSCSSAPACEELVSTEWHAPGIGHVLGSCQGGKRLLSQTFSGLAR